jgi:hypothetical protein
MCMCKQIIINMNMDTYITYMCIYTGIFLRIYTYVSVYAYVYIYSCMYLCIYSYVYTYIYIYIYVYIYIYIYMYMYVYLCIHIYVQIYICRDTCIFRYGYICIYVFIHVSMNMNICMNTLLIPVYYVYITINIFLNLFLGGVVGGGVYELVQKCIESGRFGTIGASIEIAKICVRTLDKPRDMKLVGDTVLCTDYADILEDDSINCVVELIGGTDNAKDIIFKAIKKGKHVVTANKALIAAYLPELLVLLEENPSVSL